MMLETDALVASAEAWAKIDPDPATRCELLALIAAQDHTALVAAMRGRLAFGTAGLRGIMGPGPRRMNRLVVRQSTFGLAKHLLKDVPDAHSRGVVVGYDGRLNSQVFAHDAAGVLAQLGFVVHVFDRALPTPVAGFAVKQLFAAAGIVITASHNPPAYNGLKVYWHDGAQIVPPTDLCIAQEIDACATQEAEIACLDLKTARTTGRINTLGEAMIGDYQRAVVQALDPIRGPTGPVARHDLRIAYTPLHGVGAQLAEPLLKARGFDQVSVVPAQHDIDGTFCTVTSPNPEEPDSLAMLLAHAEATGADLACANDPDADRLAVAVKDGDRMRILDGNELGLLLAHARLQQTANLSKRPVVGTTLVSSRLLLHMAQSFGARYFETLTGFKWLSRQAMAANTSSERFCFAYEEALGYAVCDVVWDKDGISALLAICLLASKLKQQDVTLIDALACLEGQFGLSLSRQKTTTLLDHQAKAVMQKLRHDTQKEVGDFLVTHTTDLLAPQHTRTWPASDALIFALVAKTADDDALEAQARIIVRPSGTEPKLKCYYELTVPPQKNRHTNPQQKKDEAHQRLEALMHLHQGHVLAHL